MAWSSERSTSPLSAMMTSWCEFVRHRSTRMSGSLGADDVIDYTREDFTRRGVRYDLIFDVPGNRPFSAFRRALEPDGRYVPIGHEHFGAAGNRVFGLFPHFFKLMFLSRFVKQLRGPGLPAPTRKDAMAVLRELLEAGKIRPIIDSTYPLSEAREAIRHMIEDELHGKVIIIAAETAGRNPALR